MVIVELDDRNRKALRTINDPVEVYKAMRDHFQFPGRSLVCVQDADIERQIIDGRAVESIYAMADLNAGKSYP